MPNFGRLSRARPQGELSSPSLQKEPSHKGSSLQSGSTPSLTAGVPRSLHEQPELEEEILQEAGPSTTSGIANWGVPEMDEDEMGSKQELSTDHGGHEEKDESKRSHTNVTITLQEEDGEPATVLSGVEK